mmetsp:Transcript_3943/g.24890  ORF Transcript_3943/g.24890 Transcript_3943/m.24890 type:complete len:354 (+) Transcript_3943:218-1279(+)
MNDKAAPQVIAHLAFILSCAALASSYIAAERLSLLGPYWFTFFRFFTATSIAVVVHITYVCRHCFQLGFHLKHIPDEAMRASSKLWTTLPNLVVISVSYFFYTVSFSFLVQHCSYFIGAVAPLAVAQIASLLLFVCKRSERKWEAVISVGTSMLANTLGCYLIVDGSSSVVVCPTAVKWVLSIYSGCMWFMFLAVQRPQQEDPSNGTLQLLIIATATSFLFAVLTSPLPTYRSLPFLDLGVLGLVPGFLGLSLMNYSLPHISTLTATCGSSLELVFVLIIKCLTGSAELYWFTLLGLSLVIGAQILPVMIKEDFRVGLALSPLMVVSTACCSIFCLYAMVVLDRNDRTPPSAG